MKIQPLFAFYNVRNKQNDNNKSIFSSQFLSSKDTISFSARRTDKSVDERMT